MIEMKAMKDEMIEMKALMSSSFDKVSITTVKLSASY
uniref:Uncharacterized protein n=1 Tax=Cucumis melo TaxID=3656 RepID=A0A9I9E825_CUCME